jgi:hypothetical protein
MGRDGRSGGSGDGPEVPAVGCGDGSAQGVRVEPERRVRGRGGRRVPGMVEALIVSRRGALTDALGVRGRAQARRRLGPLHPRSLARRPLGGNTSAQAPAPRAAPRRARARVGSGGPVVRGWCSPVGRGGLGRRPVWGAVALRCGAGAPRLGARSVGATRGTAGGDDRGACAALTPRLSLRRVESPQGSPATMRRAPAPGGMRTWTHERDLRWRTPSSAGCSHPSACSPP